MGKKNERQKKKKEAYLDGYASFYIVTKQPDRTGFPSFLLNNLPYD